MKVWLLGSGFSHRLGGPLLDGLLSRRSFDELRHRHPNTWLSETVHDHVVAAFCEGLTQGYWLDAEDYLMQLGSYDRTAAYRFDAILKAVLPSAEYETLRTTVSTFPGDDTSARIMECCYYAALPIIAAQCGDFLERSKCDPEGWLSYDRWAKAISTDDVIISFNYDEVVELAMERNGRPLWVPNPRRPPIARQRQGSLTLLKLHGSVTFRDTILSPSEPNTISNLDRNPAFIAIPGRAKRDDCATEYDELWELAHGAIVECDSMAIIGFRCPPSDEMAKALLIDSLAKNERKPAIDLVLGQDERSASRLQSLLTAFSTIRNTALFAQDYLSLCGVGNGWQNTDVFPGDFPPDGDD